MINNQENSSLQLINSIFADVKISEFIVIENLAFNISNTKFLNIEKESTLFFLFNNFILVLLLNQNNKLYLLNNTISGTTHSGNYYCQFFRDYSF